MILIGIDDRPAAQDALVLGRWLASARSEELLLAWVHPYEQLPGLLGDGPEQVAVRRAIENMAEDVRAALPVELRPEMRLVSARSAAQGLQDLAEREGASLIVLGASERARIGRVLPGSTAVRLLSGSSVPVAIAPREYRDQPEREPTVGVGFDASAEAERALDWAAALAVDAGGRLRLLAVHEPIEFPSVGSGAVPIEAVRRALRRRLREEVNKAAAGMAGDLTVETVLTDGKPAVQLAQASTELDLLVLGSRGYGPVRSVLLGSVSEAIVAAAAAPVVLVPRDLGN